MLIKAALINTFRFRTDEMIMCNVIVVAHSDFISSLSSFSSVFKLMSLLLIVFFVCFFSGPNFTVFA